MPWVWKCEHCGAGNTSEGPTSDGALCAACGRVHRKRASKPKPVQAPKVIR